MNPRDDVLASQNNRFYQQYQPVLQEKITRFLYYMLAPLLLDQNADSEIKSNDTAYEFHYHAALTSNEVAIEQLQHVSIDILNSELPPVTAAGKLAAEGRFDKAEWLCLQGANQDAMLIGAAIGGQLDYLQQPGNARWYIDDNVKDAVVVFAAYNNQLAVVNAALKHEPCYRYAAMGAALAGHFDLVEILCTNEYANPNNLMNIGHLAFDCLRARLHNPHDGLRFLAACTNDVFRQNIAMYLDRDDLCDIKELRLPYQAVSLVKKATTIRRLMEQKSLSYDAALEKAAQHPYITKANLTISSFFNRSGTVSKPYDEQKAPVSNKQPALK